MFVLAMLLCMFVGGLLAGVAGAIAWLNPKQERLMTTLRRQDQALAMEIQNAKQYRDTYARLVALSDQHGRALEEIRLLKSLCMTPSDLS